MVDTTNFKIDGGFRGSTRNMHLIERFTRVYCDTLRYDFTVDDPATWTKSWMASIPMVRTDDLIFDTRAMKAITALKAFSRVPVDQDTHPPAKK